LKTAQARFSAPFAEGVGRLERAAVLGVLAFVLVLVGAAVLAGGHGALVALRAVPRSVFGIMLAMSAFNYLMRALRWLLFSRAIGIIVPARLNALYYVAGFAMTATPGKLGEALRLWLLRRAHGCGYADTAGLLIADRLWDAVAMAAVLCGSVAWMAQYLWASLAASALVSGIALLCLKPSLLLGAVGLAASRVPGRRRMFAAWRRALRKLARLARADVFALGLVLGVAGWLSEALSLYVLLHAIGVPIRPMACVFIFAFSMIVGAISVLPGGLGSTEATMAGLLSLQGVPLDVAIVATAIVRITTLWFAVGLGILALAPALRQTRHRVPASL